MIYFYFLQLRQDECVAGSDCASGSASSCAVSSSSSGSKDTVGSRDDVAVGAEDAGGADSMSSAPRALASILACRRASTAAVSRRQERGDDFYLAGRSMPIWAVAISTLATALSAATFLGGPQQSFRGDLSYLVFKFSGLAAFIIVGVLFLPAIFRAGTPKSLDALKSWKK